MAYDLLRRRAHEFIDQFEDMLQLAGAVHRQTATQKSKQQHDEQNDNNLAHHPVGPRVGGICGRQMDCVQENIGRTSQ